MDKEASRQIKKNDESCKETSRKKIQSARLGASTTFRSISGLALPSMHHKKFTSPIVMPFFETSAITLCGTAGKFSIIQP
jgi:hypothetical protein